VKYPSFCNQNLQTTPMCGQLFRSQQCNQTLRLSRRTAMSQHVKRAILKMMQLLVLARVVNHALL
jgi:hypothetical protein